MKIITIANEVKNSIDTISFPYEVRIQSIGAVIDASHQILQGLQDSLIKTRQEGEKIKAELRETLAKNNCLRRKDFDASLQDIASTQDVREKEVKDLLTAYVHEQKEMAKALRDNLEKFKASLARGEAPRVKESQEAIKGILAKQDERKDVVTSRLKEFQREQKAVTSSLKELLAKGREVRIKDFKATLKKFEAQGHERSVRQEERRKEVSSRDELKRKVRR